MSPAAGCPEVEALAAELALGGLSGADRALAIAHLGLCPGCRRYVDELAIVADALLLLVAEVEPSIGFESRVLAATSAAARAGERPVPLAPAREARRRRLLQPLWRGLAAAVVVAVAAAGGLIVGHRIDDHQEALRTAVAVTANGRSTCHAIAYGNKDAWVFVSVDAPVAWTADYSVEVITAGGGSPVAVGHFHLQDGTGSFGATVAVPASRLLAVRVLDPSGALRYEAPFRTA